MASSSGLKPAQAIPNLFKVPELKEKILFTLLCLAIYRLGSHITTPGVDVPALRADTARHGPALERAAPAVFTDWLDRCGLRGDR